MTAWNDGTKKRWMGGRLKDLKYIRVFTSNPWDATNP